MYSSQKRDTGRDEQLREEPAHREVHGVPGGEVHLFLGRDIGESFIWAALFLREKLLFQCLLQAEGYHLVRGHDFQ